MIDQLKPLLGKLAIFSQERMGFKHPPKLFLRNDSQNSQQTLGKTAFYNPEERSVTLFVHGRHPKDILRSFAHELVHHCQNERGDLSPDKITASGANYAQECPHMRKMEKEAYLKGNMCFRDWEDEYKLTLQESKFLKENKTMTTKITKEFLKETIKSILSEGAREMIKVRDLSKGGELDKSEAVQKLLTMVNNNKKDASMLLKQYGSVQSALEALEGLSPGAIAGKIKAAKLFAGSAINEKDGELEVGPGLPDTIKPDLEIKPTLKQLIKQKQDEIMGTMEDAVAQLKAELEAMEKAYSEVAPLKLEEEAETVDEGACPKCGMSPCGCPMHEETELEENEELEENAFVVAADEAADAGKKEFEFPKGSGKMHPVKLKAGGDTIKESKIQTPEQENALYEQRFAPKNNRLFEKLVKEWTK